jgi:hypothetical protein
MFSRLKIGAEIKQNKPKEKITMKQKSNEKKSTHSGVRAARSISTKIARDCEVGETLKIAGILRRVDVVNTVYGPQPQFSGDFVAEYRGERFAAKKAYLPAAAAELLESADLSQGQAQFCFVIKKVASERTKQGYAWSVEVPLAPEVSASPALALLDYSD